MNGDKLKKIGIGFGISVIALFMIIISATLNIDEKTIEKEIPKAFNKSEECEGVFEKAFSKDEDRPSKELLEKCINFPKESSNVMLEETFEQEPISNNDVKEKIKNYLVEGLDEGWISQPESQQELDRIVDDLTSSLSEYRKTNEILKSYSTVEILEDILDDKTTALDDRIEYHSMMETKDGINEENLLYVVEEIEHEVVVCKQNKYPTTLNDLLYNLRFELEYMIKSGYGKDPSITPILQRAKESINAYSNCIYKSED